MSIAVELREAGLSDAEPIIEFDSRSGRGAMAEDSYRSVISDPNRLVLVAETAGAVVGWAKTHFWDHGDGPAGAGHYLGGVTVDPAWRRQGIGGRMTQERLGWIWNRSPLAWYVVNAKNRASIEMHRRWGFAQVAEGPRFHTTTFDGRSGLLMCAQRPIG